MKDAEARRIHPHTLYRAFKYTVYVLLAFNVFLFFQEEVLSAREMLGDDIALLDYYKAYTATLDTLAWVILLLLFELETWVLDDSRIRGAVKWSLHGVRGCCYVFICWAFWGYCAKTLMYYDTALLPGIETLCTLADGSWSFVTTLDEYARIDPVNCSAMAGSGPFWQIGNVALVADGAQLEAARWLAWTDVINAGTWIGVVMVLELDVYLQTRGLFEGTIFRTSYAIKSVLYSVLLAAAVYWGLEGDFLDFWDAFLWLLAFACIELNVFGWHRETTGSTRLID